MNNSQEFAKHSFSSLGFRLGYTSSCGVKAPSGACKVYFRANFDVNRRSTSSRSCPIYLSVILGIFNKLQAVRFHILKTLFLIKYQLASSPDQVFPSLFSAPRMGQIMFYRMEASGPGLEELFTFIYVFNGPLKWHLLQN